MKNELKISTLSIVCALCTAVVTPVFGASAVRSLGGVGTYNGASSAAAAKSGNVSDSSAINSVRGGSVRLNNASANKGAASATRTSTTRAATTPRLSIGKYLSGSNVISGGSANRPIDPGQSDSGNLQQRIRVLEEFMGYSATGAKIPAQIQAIELDVEKLQSDLQAVSGEHTTVDYKDGVLTIAQKGETVSYDLAAQFAGKSEFDALQASLDDFLQVDDLADYALKTDIQGLIDDAEFQAARKELEALIETKADMGDVANSAELQGLKAKIDALELGAGATSGQVGELAGAVAALKTTVENDYATLAALNNMQNALAQQFVTTEQLQSQYYTQEQIDEMILGVGFDETVLNDYAKKAEVQNEISALRSGMELKADQDSVDDLSDSVGALQGQINNVSSAAQDASQAASDAADLANANKQKIDMLGTAAMQDASAFATAAQGQLAESALQADALADYAKSADVTQALNDKASLADLGALSDEVSGLSTELTTVSTALDTKANAADVYTKGEIDTKIQNAADGIDLSGKQDKLVAGDYIDISGNVISSTIHGSDSVSISADGELSVGQITAASIPANTITGDMILNESITAADIKDYSITNTKLGPRSVTADKIDAGNVPAGEMIMYMSNGDGTAELVTITVDAEEETQEI